MKSFSIIEKYGSGIQRIINYFEEANLPRPVFENISDGFQVVVFDGYDEKGTEKGYVVESDEPRCVKPHQRMTFRQKIKL